MFGEITGGIMSLSEIGEIAKECWLEIPLHFHHTVLDAWVIMPNHLHGILILDYTIHELEDLPDRQLENPVKDSKAASIGIIVGSYKSAVSHLMNEHNGNSGSSIWQRNYYDRIIRDTAEFERTRRYFALNPVRWDSDPENIRLTSVHV